MANFIIYTYQFSPIRNANYSMFDNIGTPEERMAKKQDYLEDILRHPNLEFKYKNTVYRSQCIYKDFHFFVFQIANDRPVRIEENFKKKKQSNYPSSYIIIDNRAGIQHIAIEECISSFTDTITVSNILKSTFNRYLKEKGLVVDISKEYQDSEFWRLIDEHKESGISMVRFHIDYPNLPRVRDSIRDLLSTASKESNSKQTSLEFKADANETLELSKDNVEIEGLAKASADSGSTIYIKAKKVRKFIKTGKTCKTVEIDNMNAVIKDDLHNKAYEKLAAMFNTIK